MKMLLGVMSLLLVGACGGSGEGGACSESQLEGGWKNDEGRLVFKSDCTGTESSCKMKFTYPNVTAYAGTVTINVTSEKTEEGCLDKGEHECTYSLTSPGLNLDCGGGPQEFIQD